jgi:hypothetical protein
MIEGKMIKKLEKQRNDFANNYFALNWDATGVRLFSIVSTKTATSTSSGQAELQTQTRTP